MIRLRMTLVALVAALAGAAVGLGQAQADSTTTTPTTTTPDTIVVNGSDAIQAAPGSSAADDQSTYQTALGAAIANAQAKASFIAEQVDATLGPITNVTENSDSSELCQGPIVTPFTARPSLPRGANSHHHRSVARAVKADVIATGCSIEADVTLTFDMTPA